MRMKAFLAVMLVAGVYVVVYYRLMVRHCYERQYGIRENAFGALFSFAPYFRLDAGGRRYARRHIAAVGVLVLVVGSLVAFTDVKFSFPESFGEISPAIGVNVPGG